MTTPLFRPPWWLANRHVQTSIQQLLPVRYVAPLVWEEVGLDDGDFLELAWLQLTTIGPVVVLIPGLSGTVYSRSVATMANHLARAGYRVAVMHRRGAGRELNTQTRTTPASDISDLSSVITNVIIQNPGVPVALMGFSLGGSMMLKYLVHHPESPVCAAWGVSVPYDLKHCAENMPSLYQWYLLRDLKAQIEKRIQAGQNIPLSSAELASIKTIKEFDERITAPLHQFNSADDYYAHSCQPSELARITLPAQLIHAADDPIAPVAQLPKANQFSASTDLQLLASGGHLGFIAHGQPLLPRYWLAEAAQCFLTPRMGVALSDDSLEAAG